MKKGKLFAVLLVAGLFLSFATGSESSDSTSTSNKSSQGNTTAAVEEDKKDETVNEVKEDEVKEEVKTGPAKVGIGEVFGNKTISGAVIYANLDYKDYDDIWIDVPEGKKAILIKVRVTNISGKSNYVSVGDFDCYVEDVKTSPELFAGTDLEYNANIESGRSAILGAVYFIPSDAKNIELEYNPIGETTDRQIIVISDESTVETIFEAEDNAGNISKESSANAKVVGIGEEFGNKTITGVVQNVDLDYKGYDNVWTTIPDGKKAIFIEIKVSNISNEPNYVSVGDFDCYVDDVQISAELFTGSDLDYNSNIDSGRSAILGAMYVIPENANSIELEYNPFGELAERTIIKIK